jgi:hypothetical protein
MAFVTFPTEEAYAAWQKVRFSLGRGHTALEGKGGQPVLAVPDTVLDELERLGVPFRPIPEGQLPEHLSPRGLAYYWRLRAHRPEHLRFDPTLPPALHVALSCTVPEVHVEAVRQVVERYAPLEFRTTEVSLHSIPVEPDGPAEVLPMVRVEFVVPRARQQAPVEELLARGAAGTSPLTAVYVLSDPDGLPHEEKDSPGPP